MSLPAQREQRRVDRFPTDGTAKLKSAIGGNWYTVNIVDLSKTGAGISGNFLKKKGSLVELVIRAADGVDLFFVGQVVWSNGDRVGIKFLR